MLVGHEFPRVAAEIHVRDDRLRLEDHAVVVGADVLGFQLLGEEGHVVRKAQEVLFEGVRASLARDGDFAGFVVVSEGAKAFDGQDIIASDAVVENDATADFEHVRSLREVLRSDISVSAGAHGQSGGDERNSYASLHDQTSIILTAGKFASTSAFFSL